MNGHQIVENIVDSVTENQGKIVVTTTISLDRSALEQRLPTGARAEPTAFSGGGLDAGLLEGGLNYQRMQQAVVSGKITLLQIGPKTYLGLVNGRRVKAHPLCIGDTLFIFVSRHDSLTGMAEMIAELMRQLPPSASWNGQDRSAQIEQIAQFLNTP
ncbi:MAG: hypothetical protein H7Z41_02220 [Cytophagales bacterium]|nr:hypothetical protein [Armatimonadota bacterium]